MTTARDFIWFTVRNRDSGLLHSEGYWSDVGDRLVNVVDPATGGTVSRLFYGGAGLIEVSPIVLAANMVVQTLEIQLSQLDDRVADLIRFYDPKQGRLTIFRGFLNPLTGVMPAPASPIFYGRINEVEVSTPQEGGDGMVLVRAVTATQELTRSNPATRSDNDQRRRSSTDNFFQDVGTAGQLEIFWGTAKP